MSGVERAESRRGERDSRDGRGARYYFGTVDLYPKRIEQGMEVCFFLAKS